MECVSQNCRRWREGTRELVPQAGAAGSHRGLVRNFGVYKVLNHPVQLESPPQACQVQSEAQKDMMYVCRIEPITVAGNNDAGVSFRTLHNGLPCSCACVLVMWRTGAS